MRALFGPRVKNRPLSDAHAIEELERAAKMRWPVTACVPSSTKYDWLRHPHAYSVLHPLVDRDGKKYVRLRDPHGEHYRTDVPSGVILEDDGKMLLPASFIVAFFPQTFVHELADEGD